MIKSILSQLLEIKGVNIAAVVGRDGFVIESMGHGAVDTDALGAMTSTGIRYFEFLGYELDKGEVRQVMLDLQKGTIILVPVSKEVFMAIITDPKANTGHITHESGKTRQRLMAAM
jgi:predicted regulator of Ras-like GTPase activity (Roadblock/LC7/MglB family)